MTNDDAGVDRETDVPTARKSKMFTGVPYIRRVSEPGLTAPQGRTLSDQIRKMREDRTRDEVAQAEADAYRSQIEASKLRAQAEIEQAKKALSGNSPGQTSPAKEAMEIMKMGEDLKQSMTGGQDQFQKTIQTFSALKGLSGDNSNNEIMLRMLERMGEKDLRTAEMFGKMQADMNSRIGDLQTLLVKVTGDSERKVMEERLKAIQDQLNQGGVGGLVKSFGDLKSMMSMFPQGNQMPPEAQAAIEQHKNMTEMEMLKMRLDHQEKEADRKADAEKWSALIQTGVAVAQPLLQKMAEASMMKVMSGQGKVQSAPPALPPASQAPAPQPPVNLYGPRPAAIAGPGPEVAYFEKPPGKTEWDLECGNCQNKFHCVDGSEAYICGNCGTVHKPGPPPPQGA